MLIGRKLLFFSLLPLKALTPGFWSGLGAAKRRKDCSSPTGAITAACMVHTSLRHLYEPYNLPIRTQGTSNRKTTFSISLAYFAAKIIGVAMIPTNRGTQSSIPTTKIALSIPLIFCVGLARNRTSLFFVFGLRPSNTSLCELSANPKITPKSTYRNTDIAMMRTFMGKT